MADFDCPHCKATVHDGDIPDHVRDAAEGDGIMKYECGCGCTFDVLVEWDPVFHVIDETVKPRRGLTP